MTISVSKHAAIWLGVAVSLFLNLSAQAKRHHQATEETAPSAPLAVPPPNDTARFLAGMPVSKNSPLARLTQDPAWKEHSANFEKAFAKLYLKQLQKLHGWQQAYVPESSEPLPVAYYMFSGPDFLYLDQIFPKASTYILCGKESMGPPPDPLRIENLSAALHNLETAMYSSLRFSFFITKDMKVDLDRQQLNGTLPIIYVFLARADKTINDVTYGSLSSNGTFEQSRPGRGGTPGVRIKYTDNRSGNRTDAVLFHHRYFGWWHQLISGIPAILRPFWRRRQSAQSILISDV